jgi:hypothetical protein
MYTLRINSQKGTFHLSHMGNVRRFLVVLAVFLMPFTALSAHMPNSVEKARVRSVIKEVENISRHCETLDEFGMATVSQGKKILSMGPVAVYALSNWLESPDWKVRFWITDMLGYLENPDAKRPLLRVIRNGAEKQIVREQAQRSLKRIATPLEHENQEQ